MTFPFTETEFGGGGIYAHYDLPEMFNIERFYAYKTAGSADFIHTLSFNRHWSGVQLFNEDFHSFVFDVVGTYQFGNNDSKGIIAYGLFAKVGYKFKSILATPLLSIRESYASGGKSSDNKIRTFEAAFGAGDKFYGWMNITSWSNLDDREIVLEPFPKKDFGIEIKYNMFYIPANENFKLLTNLKLKPAKNHLGDELNIFVRYTLNKNWQFVGVFGYFWPMNVMNINNEISTNASIAALQIQYSFNKKLK